MMEKNVKKYNVAAGLTIFIGLPVLFWWVGNFPRRTVLKELISLITIVSFVLMLGQFYLSRNNASIFKPHKMGKVIKWHKILGYVFIPILFIHPFLVVVPRFFEAGVNPIEAFVTLITSFGNNGVILGMIAWGVMLIIGLTSFFRNQLPMSYKSWRILHGILSIAFVVFAVAHVLLLGRHVDSTVSVFVILLAAVGIGLLLRTYFFNSSKLEEERSKTR
jgi:predicted ferric reductase